MIIYSALPPLFDKEEQITESFSELKNGVLMFYERADNGKRVLKFSTDPKTYLERKKPLQ